MYLVLQLSALFLVSAFQPLYDSDSYQLPAQNILNGQSITLYDKEGWQYQVGDVRFWSDTLNSGGDWKAVRPILQGEYFPEDWNGYGWFQWRFSVSDSLIGKTLLVYGRIYGAMDVYLNNELIYSVGKLATNVDDEITDGYFSPFSVTFQQPGQHRIHIRYSNFKYKTFWKHAPSGPLLSIGLADVVSNLHEKQLAEFSNAHTIYLFSMGFFAALFFLHMMLFVYYRSEKANLLYSLLMLANLIWLYGGYILGTKMLPEDFAAYLISEGIFSVIFSVLNLYFIYLITNRRINWWPKIFTLIAIITALIMIFFPGILRIASLFLLYTSYVSAIWIISRERIVNGNNKLDVILLVYAGYFILVLPRTISIVFLTPETSILWARNFELFLMAPLLIPAGYSIYLSRDVANTNSKLKRQLEENDLLYHAKVKAEQEKQKLITRQNEMLEKEVAERTKELLSKNESLITANEEIERQRDEVVRARDGLETSLQQLKAAQAQLIQSEKMASLGELTAGIAHEIQNPLNFVNNFSEVSVEMIDELREEQAAGNTEFVAEITDSLKENLIKINHHGKRADSIVKGMLEHSRNSTGEKVPTDINAVVEEYLRLSYHGLRAKDKSFNASFLTEFDKNMPQIDVNPQEIGRVLLNLINNAFQAVNGYSVKPTVTLTTKKEGGGIQITVSDNGPGIPDAIKDKIFQPFFTTKKGTQGTGLGLSISHDIVKAHGGTIEIQSELGSGSSFIVSLPMN